MFGPANCVMRGKMFFSPTQDKFPVRLFSAITSDRLETLSHLSSFRLKVYPIKKRLDLV